MLKTVVLLLCYPMFALAQWTTPMPFAESYQSWYSIRDAQGHEVALANGWDAAALIWMAPELADALKDCQTDRCKELLERLQSKSVRLEPLCTLSQLDQLAAKHKACRERAFWLQNAIRTRAASADETYRSQVPQPVRDVFSWFYWAGGYAWPEFQ